jgi:transcriptional regulator with XRE-family HTH domain
MIRLTRERERLGWSKQRLAQEARISPPYISQAESSRRIPYPRELERIANALGWDGAPAGLLEDADDARD